MRKEQTEEDVFTRWEKDFELVPVGEQGLFYEYLELGQSVVYTYMYLRTSMVRIKNTCVKSKSSY